MGSFFGGSPTSVIMPGTYTVATLPTPSASNVDMYARVTDLFGAKRDLVLCSLVGAGYFWQPVRPVSAANRSADANFTLTTLQDQTVLFLTGTLTANRTYTISLTNAFPGAAFELAMDAALGVFTATIAGLDGGSVLALSLSGRRRVFFDGVSSTWKGF